MLDVNRSFCGIEPLWGLRVHVRWSS